MKVSHPSQITVECNLHEKLMKIIPACKSISK